MIDHERKFIFIHIPKTGGTSVEHTLFSSWEEISKNELFGGPNPYQMDNLCHLKFNHIIQSVGEKIFNSYFKFSFVRNPWDKAVSLFFFSQRPNRKDLRSLLKLEDTYDFKTFVSALIEAPSHPFFDSQHTFFYKDGKSCIDFIGKIENFQNDFDIICENIGITNTTLPRLHCTEHSLYTNYYDDKTIDSIAKRYKEDIIYFNYEYGK